MAQFRAGAPEVGGRDAPETEFDGVLLHDVPNQAFGHAVTPALSGSALTDMQAWSLSRTAPAKWCALHCSARTARRVRSRAGKTQRSRGDGVSRVWPRIVFVSIDGAKRV